MEQQQASTKAQSDTGEAIHLAKQIAEKEGIAGFYQYKVFRSSSEMSMKIDLVELEDWAARSLACLSATASTIDIMKRHLDFCLVV